MRILIIIFYIGTIPSIAQTKILDQEYYTIIKNKTLKFEQKKNIFYVTNCTKFEKCDSLPESSFLILRDSIINNKTKKIVLKNLNDNLVTENFQDTIEFRKKNIILIDYKNGRKAIEENYKYRRNSKTRLAILYPKSELIKLKSISEITQTEAKEILMEFNEFTIDKEESDYNEFESWKIFNDLVTEKGYNPIGAENEIRKKSN